MTTRLKSRAEFRQFEAFVRAIFSSNSTDEIESHLRGLSAPAPYRLRMKVIYSRSFPLNVFKGLTRRMGESLQAAQSGFVYRKVGRHTDSIVTAQFAVLPSLADRMGILASVSTRLQWQALLSMVRNHYPTLVPVYLSQAELLRTVMQLRARVPEYVVRVRGISAREGLRSVREWTDENLEAALGHISDRRQSVSSIEMAFHRRIQESSDVSPEALCKLTKNSEVEISGAYTLARKAVLDHVAEVGLSKLEKYANRGLREREYSPAPLAIRFRTPVLKDLSEVRKLVAVLSKYPHSMHAVQHGNPYAHVRVSDVYDGSSFDIWAVSGDSIAVIPGLKATEAAIGRLINYVFEQFREGEVQEYAS